MTDCHPTVFILGFSEAAVFLRHKSAGRLGAIIAIHGNREFPVDTESVPHSLILRIDDVEAPDQTEFLEAARIRVRQREAEDAGLSLIPPTEDHARTIIEFAQGIRDMDGALLCQCQAGISRSAGAALLCLAEWTQPGQESACVGHVLNVRPSALPHRDLVRFGDKLLNRGGRLLAALDAMHS